MYIQFWGTRGSLPASLKAKQVREKALPSDPGITVA